MPGPVRLYWRAMWTLVSPLVLAVVIILKWVEYKDMNFETSTGGIYVYPTGVQVLGWLWSALKHLARIGCATSHLW